MTPIAANVFINCPFDKEYDPLFEAMVFAVIRCGFRVRCMKEISNGAINRLANIMDLISQSQHSIHDISRTELNPKGLPRFNMPFELGIFIGSRHFGGLAHAKKSCLIFDKEQYRYDEFISDIAGQDIASHDNDELTLIYKVANYFRNHSPIERIPSAAVLRKDYENYRKYLVRYCRSRRLNHTDIPYPNLLDSLTKFFIAKAKPTA